MISESLPFQGLPLTSATLAGAALWSLALYLAFFPAGEWMAAQLTGWMNRAGGSLDVPKTELEHKQQARESQSAFLASLLSVVPFLALGGLCNLGIEVSMGQSWAVSVGLMASVMGGVYELGRRAG